MQRSQEGSIRTGSYLTEKLDRRISGERDTVSSVLSYLSAICMQGLESELVVCGLD